MERRDRVVFVRRGAYLARMDQWQYAAPETRPPPHPPPPTHQATGRLTTVAASVYRRLAELTSRLPMASSFGLATYRRAVTRAISATTSSSRSEGPARSRPMTPSTQTPPRPNHPRRLPRDVGNARIPRDSRASRAYSASRFGRSDTHGSPHAPTASILFDTPRLPSRRHSGRPAQI